MKIKGWKKQNGYDWWNNTHIGQTLSIELSKGYLTPLKWAVIVTKPQYLYRKNRAFGFRTKAQAVKFAISWMKRHPRG